MIVEISFDVTEILLLIDLEGIAKSICLESDVQLFKEKIKKKKNKLPSYRT